MYFTVATRICLITGAVCHIYLWALLVSGGRWLLEWRENKQPQYNDCPHLLTYTAQQIRVQISPVCFDRLIDWVTHCFLELSVTHVSLAVSIVQPKLFFLIFKKSPVIV